METIKQTMDNMTAESREASMNMDSQLFSPPKDIPPFTKAWYECWEKYLNSERREPREGIECPICKNKEVIITVGADGIKPRKCSCFEKRNALARLRELGFEEQTKRYTFESYQTPQSWQKQAKQIALQFVKNPDRQWFLLAGQSGAGKTHLAVAAASTLFQQGLNLHYMRWVESAPQLKANVNDAVIYRDLLQPMRKCDVLYIDDLWKCKGQAEPSDADVRLAFDILDYRYNSSGRTTIISTEWTGKQLIQIDEALGGRIFERTKGSQIVLIGKEKNWRLYGGAR